MNIKLIRIILLVVAAAYLETVGMAVETKEERYKRMVAGALAFPADKLKVSDLDSDDLATYGLGAYEGTVVESTDASFYPVVIVIGKYGSLIKADAVKKMNDVIEAAKERGTSPSSLLYWKQDIGDGRVAYWGIGAGGNDASVGFVWVQSPKQKLDVTLWVELRTDGAIDTDKAPASYRKMLEAEPEDLSKGLVGLAADIVNPDVIVQINSDNGTPSPSVSSVLQSENQADDSISIPRPPEPSNLIFYTIVVAAVLLVGGLGGGLMWRWWRRSNSAGS